MLFQCTLLIPTLAATLKGANKGLLSSVDSGVNQKVCGSQEGFSATGELTRMRLSSLMVSSAVVNQVAL